MSRSSKEVLYEVLYEAIQCIRLLSSKGPVSEERRTLIWALSYAVHNWPAGLRDAKCDEDYDAFLAYSWHWCPPPAREWLEGTLRGLGVEPSDLPPPNA